MGKGPKARGKAAGKLARRSVDQVEALLCEAEELLANEEYEDALSLLREAHSRAPTHAKAAETLGSALAEFGDPEEAVCALLSAVSLSPEDGFEKHMYLGQLLAGADGIAHYRRGVELLEEAASKRPSEESRGALSQGLCSLAEGLLSESASCEEVSGECRQLLDRAAALAPHSPEPLQALAALRALMGFPEEALALLRQSLARWLPSEAAADQGDARLADAALPQPLSPFAEPPGFAFRFETAKLLLELDDSTATAVRVLEELLEERDDEFELWFLLALAHHGACAFARATQCLDQAEELLGARPDEEKRTEMLHELQSLRAAVQTSAAAWKEDGGCEEPDEAEEEEEADEEE